MFSIKISYCNHTLSVLLLFFVSHFTLSQNETLEIDYSSVLLDEKDDYGSCSFFNGKLTTNGVKSVYTITLKDTIVNSERFGLIDNSEFKFSGFSKSYYKDPIKQIVYYREKRGMERPKLIKDNYKFEWEIVNEYINVLGSVCQKAVCEFRGRTIEAYFTPEIQYNDGPYKFDGLPGLVLLVRSSDGAFEIKATMITSIEEGVPVNPYDGLEHTISFKDYKKLYKKYFDNMTGYRADLDYEIYVPNRYLEVLVDE